MIRNILATTIGAALLAACGSKTPEQPAPAAQAPAEVQQAIQEAPATPPPPASRDVDVCALLSKEEAEAVVGKLSTDPTAKPSQGSLLGECDYMAASGTFLMVSARPATEFDATVKYTAKRGATEEIPGLGQKAYLTEAGVMVQPAGKPYFVVVFAAGGQPGTGKKTSVDIAKKLKL